MKIIKPKKTVDPVKANRSRRRWYLDWNRFLSRKRIKEPQRQAAMWLSSGWTTCACGVQCAIIPRHSDGEPRDEQLSKLGMQFCVYVSSDDYSAAKKVLRRIEVRSGVLIREMKRKLQREKRISLREAQHAGK